MQERTHWKTWKQVFRTPITAAIGFVFTLIGYGILVRDEFLPVGYQQWKLAKLIGTIPSRWWTAIISGVIVATIIIIVQRAHNEIVKVEHELGKWKAAKPEILVTIERVIPRTPMNSVFDVFLAVVFQLKEPQSVSIVSYSLTLQTPSGIRQSATAVEGDISEWVWLTQIGEQMFHFELIAPPNELVKRGETVTGWLHFRLGPTTENTIWNSAYFLDVISEHGISRGEIREISANRFNKNTGKILDKKLFTARTK